MTEEAAQGHFVLAYPYGTSLRWSNGRRRWLAIDGEPLQPRTPWDGNASRFNHACQNQTVYGRWKQYGGLKILEFRAKGALEGGTELAWDYNSGGSSYTISESAARALASEGIWTVPCRCRGTHECPRRRQVPLAELTRIYRPAGSAGVASPTDDRHAAASGLIRPRSKSLSQRRGSHETGPQGGDRGERIGRDLPLSTMEQELISDDSEPSNSPDRTGRRPRASDSAQTERAFTRQQRSNGAGKRRRSPSQHHEGVGERAFQRSGTVELVQSNGAALPTRAAEQARILRVVENSRDLAPRTRCSRSGPAHAKGHPRGLDHGAPPHGALRRKHSQHLERNSKSSHHVQSGLAPRGARHLQTEHQGTELPSRPAA